MLPTRSILGVNFFTGTPDELGASLDGLGLVVFPSAPVLVAMEKEEAHRVAVQSADLAVADSGWMVLLWLAIKGASIPRISGLRFLHLLLNNSAFRRAGSSFWVMPNPTDAAANRRWLGTQGIQVGAQECYDAPRYPAGFIQDEPLLNALERHRPPFVVLCLGGGVQERLGYYLRQNLSYRPTIICIGAAIAFLSGQQVGIPKWADRLYLGWLFRTLSNPKLYFPRYWGALRLAPLLAQHGETALAPIPVRNRR